MTEPLTGALDRAEIRNRERYLDLVERAVTHSVYGALDLRLMPGAGLKNWAIARVLAVMHRRGVEAVRLLPTDRVEREEGRDWPVFAQTMVGRKRLANLRSCVEGVIADEIRGDLIEAGVWRGGAAIMMRAVLEGYNVRDRAVWLADSFAGLPRPRAEHPADAGARWHQYNALAVSEEEVRDNFRRYNLLDEQVRFLSGWFEDTLPTVRDRHWALIRVDADMYGSTLEALEHLYPGLSPGGYVIVDDYGLVEACRRAVDDFRVRNGIADPIERVDWTGIYWRRGSG